MKGNKKKHGPDSRMLRNGMGTAVGGNGGWGWGWGWGWRLKSRIPDNTLLIT